MKNTTSLKYQAYFKYLETHQELRKMMIYKIVSQKYGDMELLDFINKKAVDNILASINEMA
ncbi:hypothetical protein [Leuconostoc pseudomesenteroides]|uniref:hypothetical protein n=1 Tax=Leuconostoc pseudomesenteroides TaxID=33968 RepID=UPI00166EA2FE|nr:hypothetical protein [Leuconostoc pseudomesenteroides]